MSNETDLLQQLFNKAQFFLDSTTRLEIATTNSLKKLSRLNQTSTNAQDILTIYCRVADLHIQALETINNIINKFPVKHTVQELQLLELFRNMKENEKQVLIDVLTTGEDNIDG